MIKNRSVESKNRLLNHAIKTLPNIYASKSELRKLRHFNSCSKSKQVLQKILIRHLNATLAVNENNLTKITEDELLSTFLNPSGEIAKQTFEKMMRQVRQSRTKHSEINQIQNVSKISNKGGVMV